MLNTIIAAYIGVQIYYTFKSIKQSFINKTVDEDINHKWEQLKQTCYYIKCDLLRKEHRKNDGSKR